MSDSDWLVLSIGGRKAIPVRGISFATGGHFAIDYTVRMLAGQDGFYRITFSAYKLHDDGTYTPILAKEWDRFVALLEGLTNKFMAEEKADLANYAAWRETALKMIPANTFVWLDDLEKTWAVYASPERTTFIDEQAGDRELTLYPLTTEPERAIIFEGFRQNLVDSQSDDTYSDWLDDLKWAAEATIDGSHPDKQSVLDHIYQLYGLADDYEARRKELAKPDPLKARLTFARHTYAKALAFESWQLKDACWWLTGSNPQTIAYLVSSGIRLLKMLDLDYETGQAPRFALEQRALYQKLLTAISTDGGGALPNIGLTATPVVIVGWAVSCGIPLPSSLLAAYNTLPATDTDYGERPAENQDPNTTYAKRAEAVLGEIAKREWDAYAIPYRGKKEIYNALYGKAFNIT